MTQLIIVGDEAWTLEEWAAEERRRQRAMSPEQRARRAEATRRWNAAHPERRREINRRAMQRYRRNYVGSLHDLACTGPTRATGCVCRKIRCYDKPARESAA